MEHFASVEDAVAGSSGGTPVYCLCPALLERRAREFAAGFPGRVLYAVKSNPLPAVLHGLWAAGIRDFDTASIAEIELLARELPHAGAWFMHPVKSRSAIARAYEDHGVRRFVVDDAAELGKIAAVLGRREMLVVVRVATTGEGAFFNLSEKFGASPEAAPALLDSVAAHGYRAGLAFHVGSQCREPAAFEAALERATAVLAASGTAIECVDVGGGFPVAYAGEEVPPIADFHRAIERAVARLGLPSGCELLAEPGRALVAESMSLAARVELRRGSALYLNDGVHGGLGAPTIGIDFPARGLRPGGTLGADSVEFTIYGPTCDGLDVLPRPIALPADIDEGDWVVFDRVGAYSVALRTAFNGFDGCAVVTIDEPGIAPGAAA